MWFDCDDTSVSSIVEKAAEKTISLSAHIWKQTGLEAALTVMPVTDALLQHGHLGAHDLTNAKGGPSLVLNRCS